MKEIGKEKAYDELVFTPAKYHIRRHIVYTYKCPECGEYPEDYDNETDDIERCNIRRAYYPKPMIPGSFFHTMTYRLAITRMVAAASVKYE